MWTCTKCKRIFEKTNQMHSCKSLPLEEHFKNKEHAKDLFEYLFNKINEEIGISEIISLPCCIHLYGKYDYLAILPKKDCIEIRFALNRKLDSENLTAFVKMSENVFKNCIEISKTNEINNILMNILEEAYHLKD